MTASPAQRPAWSTPTQTPASDGARCTKTSSSTLFPMNCLLPRLFPFALPPRPHLRPSRPPCPPPPRRGAPPGIGVILGKSGTGKSCLLRLLASRLPPGLYKPLYLCHTSVGIVEFYTHLSSLFGLSPCYRRASMFRDLKEHILSMNSSRHVHPVLLIDESHLLNNEILAEIRLLTNFHFDSLNALTVVLWGAENLSLRFGLSALEALANSITITNAALLKAFIAKSQQVETEHVQAVIQR